MPQRVQLRRVKGWRMPPNTVSVARPGRWGNPFYIDRWRDRELCVALFKDAMTGGWNPSTCDHLPDAHFRAVYEASVRWRKQINDFPEHAARRELRGKNLACFCALDVPCHADVLLEVANG